MFEIWIYRCVEKYMLIQEENVEYLSNFLVMAILTFLHGLTVKNTMYITFLWVYIIYISRGNLCMHTCIVYYVVFGHAWWKGTMHAQIIYSGTSP